MKTILLLPILALLFCSAPESSEDVTIKFECEKPKVDCVSYMDVEAWGYRNCLHSQLKVYDDACKTALEKLKANLAKYATTQKPCSPTSSTVTDDDEGIFADE